MHASSLLATWHHWRDGVAQAFHPHPAHFDDAPSHRLADNPIRARLRQAVGLMATSSAVFPLT